jgi:hypothetical protein
MLDDLGSEPSSYARQGVKCGRIGQIQVHQRYIDIMFQPLVYTVRNDIRFRKISFPSEATSLFPVIVYALSLLERKAQTTQIFYRDGIRVKSELFNPFSRQILSYLLRPRGMVPTFSIDPHIIRIAACRSLRSGILAEPAIHIYRIRLIPSGRNLHYSCPMDEKRGLKAYDKKHYRYHSHYERLRKSFTFLHMSHI